MSSLAHKIEPRAEHVRCTADELVVELSDGRTLTVPLVRFPRLSNSTAKQRAKFEFLGNGQGVHWPALDEDISIAGLLAGKPSFEYEPA